MQTLPRLLFTVAVISAGLPLQALASEIVAQGFSPGNAEAVVVRAIVSAKKELRVAAYSFTSKPIAKALVDAKKRGVNVEVVLDKSQEGERYTASTFLVNEGVPVRINRKYAIMHNKFMVIDGDTVETGSFNYTSAAASKNAENVLVIRDAKTAAGYAREWSRLWEESEPHAAKRASKQSSQGLSCLSFHGNGLHWRRGDRSMRYSTDRERDSGVFVHVFTSDAAVRPAAS